MRNNYFLLLILTCLSSETFANRVLRPEPEGHLRFALQSTLAERNEHRRREEILARAFQSNHNAIAALLRASNANERDEENIQRLRGQYGQSCMALVAALRAHNAELDRYLRARQNRHSSMSFNFSTTNNVLTIDCLVSDGEGASEPYRSIGTITIRYHLRDATVIRAEVGLRLEEISEERDE